MHSSTTTDDRVASMAFGMSVTALCFAMLTLGVLSAFVCFRYRDEERFVETLLGTKCTTSTATVETGGAPGGDVI